MAEKRENGKSMSVSSEQKRKEGGIAEFARVVVHALLIALVIRTFLFQPFNIPSGSMQATLLIGDFLFVSTYSYGYSKFRLPREDSTDYIKRVVGLPGDKIQVVGGLLSINGKAVERERIADWYDEDHGATVKRWREKLPNGVVYEALDLSDQGQLDDWPRPKGSVYTVPPGNYFMMGDNRDNSTDSRVPPELGGVGPVPFENIVGKAQLIFFSVAEGEAAWQFWRWPWSVRWSRLLKIVR